MAAIVVSIPKAKTVTDEKLDLVPLLLIVGPRRLELAAEPNSCCAAVGARPFVHPW
jgi:hypothetical protein